MNHYQEALNFIHSRKTHGKMPTLARMKALMDQLGNPQDSLPCIHIAGTNGKGSTATMIASVTKEAGYKTGLFTSPFIYDFRERFAINGALIGEEQLLALCKRVAAACNAMEQAGQEAPNEFEVVTAIGFLYFKEEAVDLLVMETGMGGRYDATNIIQKPLASVICSISLDHTAILGDTIEKIAYEKSGIIKEGCPIIAYQRNPETALAVIERCAQEQGAPLYIADEAALNLLDEQNNSFEYKGIPYTLTLQGPHQIANALTAIEALDCLKNKGALTFSEQQLQSGIKQAYIPARMEKIGDQPAIFLDGGHNKEGIDALLSSISALHIEEPIIIFGMMRDKPYQYAIRKLALLSHSFIGIEPPLPRAIPAHEIRDIAEPYCENVFHCSSFEEAAALAKEQSHGRPIIACGSLYTAGDIAQALKKIFSNP
ncbi:MAG: bifunctional folylpolyglutamate synthase/dihydrofolate synthase [Clostridia bacterium]|nr:bifunctional folylpolyglutamate synthase/dihydrofolate synthase [Clostridia bacterium]